ncbi:MAG: peptidase C15 [Coleofasciculus sp. B1-GNL1-01]|uniref:peptidase C15 n=1 Tax=Coleofasciculus sp. B1-GNL1-01 TaxID=3068484 RepID=UPI0032FDE279
MPTTILLTSFQTWLPHQKSNASDDLLLKLQAENDPFPDQAISLTFLRQLPVDVFPASDLAIAQIEHLQPDVVICCGMAESRSQLTVEVGATPRYLVAQVYWFIYYLVLQPILSLNGLSYCLPAFFGNETSFETQFLETAVDLEKLVEGLTETEISHDAGKFVCEGLYYQLLRYFQDYSPTTGCIFVHVPVLTPENLATILTDFRLIISRIALWSTLQHQSRRRDATTAA